MASATIDPMDEEDVDFAVLAYREDGAWTVVEASPGHVTDLDGIAAALARFGSESGVVAMVSIAEEFFVLARAAGEGLRLVLSDVSAVPVYPLAAEVAEAIGLDDDTDDDLVAVGHFGLLSDLGMDELELELLCDDIELYPDEMLTDVATRLGFGADFEAIVG